MTIRTHKMTQDSGDSDSGKMTSLTSVAIATKMYLACDEATGTTMSDKNQDTGLVFDNADGATSVAFTGATNTCEIMHSTGGSSEAATVTGTLPSPVGKSFLVWHHATPSVATTTFKLILGDNSGGNSAVVLLTGAGTTRIRDDSANAIDFTSITTIVDETHLFAIFMDRDSDTAYTFESANGATVSQKQSVDASSLTGDITFADEIQINALGAIDTYSTGMYVFTNAPTTAEVLANLETIRVNGLTSNKALPVEWLLET